MLNRSASLALSTSVLKALPGKVDIKKRSPSIIYLLFIIGKFNNNGEIEADLCNWKKRAEDIEDDDLDFLENEQLYCQL